MYWRSLGTSTRRADGRALEGRRGCPRADPGRRRPWRRAWRPLSAVSACSAAPVPRPPQPTRPTLIVPLPGRVDHRAQSGHSRAAAAPAVVVPLRNSRREADARGSGRSVTAGSPGRRGGDVPWARVVRQNDVPSCRSALPGRRQAGKPDLRHARLRGSLRIAWPTFTLLNGNLLRYVTPASRRSWGRVVGGAECA